MGRYEDERQAIRESTEVQVNLTPLWVRLHVAVQRWLWKRKVRKYLRKTRQG